MHGKREMTIETLDLEPHDKPAANIEVEVVSDRIFDCVKDFESPKDAASALILAHYRIIIACFPPECRAEAIEAVDGHAEIVKNLLNEGWE
jgi:DICT domain-containing protein